MDKLSSHDAPRRSKKIWLALATGALFGVFGAISGHTVAQFLDVDELRSLLGLSPDLRLDRWTVYAVCLALAWFLIGMMSAALFLNAHLRGSWAQKAGIHQMLGTGRSGRESALPLVYFNTANAVIVLLLAISNVWKLSPPVSLLTIVLGGICLVIMVLTAIKLWRVMDELLKVIWAEATALTCGIILVLGMLVTLGSDLALWGKMTGFQLIVGYHYIYLGVYFWVTSKRAPDMLTNPVLEDV